MSDHVYQWACPLESCNFEKGPFQPNSDDCQTAFTAHLNGHANTHFVPFILSGAWRKTFRLSESTDSA